MRISWSPPPAPLIASGLLALSLFSGGALADDAATPAAALVGAADMGRGSGGQGLSDSAPVRDRRHRLLGSTAGEHSGPAIGIQRKGPGIGQEFPADQYGSTRPSRTSRRSSTYSFSRFSMSTPSLAIPRELRQVSSRFPRIPSLASSNRGYFNSMPRSMARPTAQVLLCKGGPRSASGGT